MANPRRAHEMREQHVVPLSRQAAAILHELHTGTGPEGFLLPRVRGKRKPISENILNLALRCARNTKAQLTAHVRGRGARRAARDHDRVRRQRRRQGDVPWQAAHRARDALPRPPF
jgi:integrase